jgi:hypothetical protein
MNIERVIWTTLPKGFDADGRLVVSVHLAPRLTTDDGSDDEQTLDKFDAFSDWPKHLANIVFTVEINGKSYGAKPITDASSDLWTTVFPAAKTGVKPHRFTDHAGRYLHVFPVREVLEFIKTTYGELSAAGPNLPSIDDATGPLAAFRPLAPIATQVADASSFWDELARAKKKADEAGSEEEDPAALPVGKVVKDHFADPSLPGAAQSAQNAFFQAYRFYHRPGSQRPDFPDDYIEPPPKVPTFDFHEAIALLADHPELLRKLGLVIDLVLVDLADPVATLAPTGVISVVPDGALPAEPARLPKTRYELDKEWFGARPLKKGEMDRGLLNLSQDFWQLFQVDVDGAALQAVSFGDTLTALLDPDLRNHDTPGETGAPALHSTGLALARERRGESLLGDLVGVRNLNASIEAGQPVEFNAEDLIRGYRVDVWDGKAPDGEVWRSLHQRVTTHTVDGLGNPIEPIHDEGYIKSTAASSEREDHPTPSDDLYLHETVAAWDGWSLAAARPGKRVVEPGQGPKGSSVDAYDPAVGKVLPIVSTVRVEPQTLPRLRVGHPYRVRIRTVDIAGNSRPPSKKDLEPSHPVLASETQVFVRFEPVPSPTILRRALDTEGESLEHLVIRSDLGVKAADYATSVPVKDALAEIKAKYAYAADTHRHLAPPKGSQLMAEQHGGFESAFGANATEMTRMLRLALREEGTFLDPAIVDPATGKKTIAQTTIKAFPADAAVPTTRGAGLGASATGAYAYYPDPTVILPYLPDPLAVGVSLTVFDHTGAERAHKVAKFTQPATWDTRTPIRIRLSEGPIGLEFVNNVLETTLPQAEVLHGLLASVFPADRLEHFAIWQWTPEAKQVALETAAEEGRHWMLTPYRKITLTHAVQRPLEVPDMTKVVSSRVLGSTFAEFHGAIHNHAKSTGHLDVLAAWTEDVDLLTDDVPHWSGTNDAILHAGHAFGFDLTPGEDDAQVTKPGVKANPPTVPLAVADRIARHEFGDTKYRRVTYHSVATTRFREYLPQPIADDPTQIQRIEPAEVGVGPNTALVHDVKSSARPAAPDLLYVLPTFRWDRQDSGAIRTHVRRGKAVRVWLRRSWFSSGDGELLGVVMQPAFKLPGDWFFDDAVIGVSATEMLAAAGGPAHRKTGGAKQSKVSHLIDVSGPEVSPVPAWTHIEGLEGLGTWPGIIAVANPPPSTAELHTMLQQYTTHWGSDPVWRSRLPDLVPTPSDFPRAVAVKGDLTLEEVPSQARVVVAGHQVEYDMVRKLWSCDIEIEMGDSYYPFVRLALARFQPQSLDGAHLSRVVMTDFMQVAPDRTAQLVRGRGGYGITVRGYAGRNAVGDLTAHKSIVPEVVRPRPNTTMRASLEQRPPGIPGDLGWERVGSEVTLSAKSTTDFHVTWTGGIVPPKPPAGYDLRIVITESETFERDRMPGDLRLFTSKTGLLRERVVYADTFEL